MRVRVIYNPSAGMRTGRGELARALDELRACKWDVELAETTRPHEAFTFARAAAADNLDALIAVGGDGTMNEAANGLVGSQTALGVLPMGTGNVWAKEMGLVPGDLAASARQLGEAEIRTIDVGEVWSENLAPRVFVLWCSAGLDAAITRTVEPQRELKRRFGALFFWLVGIQEGWNFRGRQVRLHLPDQRVTQRIILALASNARLYGGVTYLAPEAKIDDGLLDLVVLKGTGAWATVWHLVRVLLRLHLHDPQTSFYKVDKVRIVANKLPVQADGEPIGWTPVEIRVRPRALKILVPKTANQGLFVNGLTPSD
jgi:diacylglycerol kinase (ATP)